MSDRSVGMIKTTLVIASVVAAVGIFLLGAYSIRWILLSAALGVGIGTLMSPLMMSFQRRYHIPRAVSAVLFLIVLLAMIVGVCALVYVVISEQIEPLANQLPTLFNSVRDRLSEWLVEFPELSARIKQWNWGPAVQKTFSGVFHGIRLGIGALGYLLYVLALSLYVATNPERHIDGALSVFPAARHAQLRHLLDESARSLRAWLSAQIIAMSGVGGLAALGLFMVGSNYWLILGLLTALLDIIPFIGPSIAALSAIVVALGSDPAKIPWVVAVFFVVEAIEAKIVIPLVMKGRISLPPAQLLTFILVLGHWFGFLGVFVAAPLFAVLRTIYLRTYVPAVNRQTQTDDMEVVQKDVA